MAEAPRPDAFAELLGITVVPHGGGRAIATVTVTADHLNPNGSCHGALIFAVAGAALAVAANDDEVSGIASAVHTDYLRPAAVGDVLVAETEIEEQLPNEDLFVVRVTREGDGQLVARGHARMRRRLRAGQLAGLPRSEGAGDA